MKMKTKISLLTILLGTLIKLSCAQDTKQNKMEMREVIKQSVSDYKQYPNYSVQVDKGGCRVQLIGNNIPLFTNLESGGFSALVPFNANILQSGEQILKIKIYPDIGKETFDEYSVLSVKVIYFENEKDRDSPRVVLKTFNIPKEVLQKKLNYFESTIVFQAAVPYNFSRQLATAKDLTKVKNIDAKVLAAYETIHSWLDKKDLKSLSEFRKEANKKACLVYYLNTDQQIEERFDYAPLFEDNSKVNPIPSYKMVFYADGKLVRLERQDNRDEILTLTGRTDDGYEVTSDLSVLLYMPEGSEDLQQF